MDSKLVYHLLLLTITKELVFIQSKNQSVKVHFGLLNFTRVNQEWSDNPELDGYSL